MPKLCNLFSGLINHLLLKKAIIIITSAFAKTSIPLIENGYSIAIVAYI